MTNVDNCIQDIFLTFHRSYGIDIVECIIDNVEAAIEDVKATIVVVNGLVDKGMTVYDALVEADYFSKFDGLRDVLISAEAVVGCYIENIMLGLEFQLIEYVVPHLEGLYGSVDDIKGLIAEGMTLKDAIVEAGVPEILKDINDSMNMIVIDAKEFLDSEYQRFLEFKFEMLKAAFMFLCPIVSDITNYVETDDSYYEYGEIAYFGADVFDLYSVGGIIDSIKESDIDMIETIEDSNVVFVKADCGVLLSVGVELLADFNNKHFTGADFSEFTDINGVDVSKIMAAFDEYVEPVIDAILKAYPDYAEAETIVAHVVDVILYNYLSALDDLDELVDSITDVNSRATVLIGGSYNIFNGSTVTIEGYEVPVGDIFDAIVSAYNVCIYEFCEDCPNAVYVDLMGMVGTGIDLENMDFESLMDGTALPNVDIDYLYDQVELTLSGMELIELFDVYWINGEDVLDVDYGLTAEERDAATYGEVPVRPADEFNRYEFKGWEKVVDEDNGDLYYYAKFDAIPVKVVISGGDDGDKDGVGGELEFDVSNIDPTVEVVKVEINGISVSLPTGLFEGCDSVKVVSKVVEKDKLPGNLHVFTEGKTVISLELFLDGAKVSEFGENKVSVSVEYALAEGEDASTLAVWYMDTDLMILEKVESTYENGVLTITTDHFSYWVIGHEVVEDEEDDADE